jgi:hypothetical protein
VHNLALPDPVKSPSAAGVVTVSPPVTSPMIQSPLPPTSYQYRGGGGSLADLTNTSPNHLPPSSYGNSGGSSKATNRSPTAAVPQQQHHTVVSLLSNSGMSKTRTTSMYEALMGALAVMPAGCDSLHLATTKDCPVFITKWIDYSNKYGFGFQLSDRSVGVLFNDNTRISYSSDRR